MRRCPQENMAKPGSAEFLDDLVKEICLTYEDERGINHIEGFNLPRENEILDILRDLLELIFPGFSGLRSYNLRTIHYNVGEILASVHPRLYDQVSRSFRFDCAMKNCDNCDIPAMSEAAVEALLLSLPELRRVMKSDVAAAYEGDPAARSFEEIILSYPGIKAITIQKMAHVLYQQGVPLLPRMMTEYAHSHTGIDIHPGATLGAGFFIDHGTGVVIGETAVIGDGAKVYQGVTLGALSFPKDENGQIIKGIKRHPTIEKNVTIYAGATILGDIVIGEGAVIGGNVWLTESVAAGAKVTISTPELTIRGKSK